MVAFNIFNWAGGGRVYRTLKRSHRRQKHEVFVHTQSRWEEVRYTILYLGVNMEARHEPLVLELGKTLENFFLKPNKHLQK